MSPVILPLFSPVLRRYVRQLGSTSPLCEEARTRPQAVQQLLVSRPRLIRQRFGYFYRVLPRLDQAQINDVEAEALTWFSENRLLLGGNIQTALQDARHAHDRFGGDHIVELLEMLQGLLEKTGYELSDETVHQAVDAFSQTRLLSTDEAESLPFLTRLLLLTHLQTLAETLLKKILTRQSATSQGSLRSLITRLPGLAKERFFPSLLYQPLTFGTAKSSPIRTSGVRSVDQSPSDPILAELLDRIEAGVEMLRHFGDIDWEELVAGASAADRQLARDPAGAYLRMTSASRSAYKERLRLLAHMTGEREHDLAQQCVTFAQASHLPHQRHVGYWLIDEGHKRFLHGYPAAYYTFAYFAPKVLRTSYLPLLELGTLVIALFVATRFDWPYAPFVFLCACFPALQLSKQLLNNIVQTCIPPAFIPTLDLKQDVTPEETSAFVIPAFLSDSGALTNLLYKIEIAYLGNRGKNLSFGLLLDAPDTAVLDPEKTAALREEAKQAITALNARYGETSAFFVFMRESLFNPSEGVYMGWERKRGKILEFMRALRAQTTTSRYELFPARPQRTEFVVVVDEDAHTPRDFVCQLIAVHAHPLQRPLLGEMGKLPIHGSTFVQPHTKLWFQERPQFFPQLFSDEPSSAAYSMQISETYQDLFGRGNFVGKGSIHVDAFLSCFDTLFPENTILSHDLLEGSIGGATFANSVVLYDEFPLNFSSYLNRLHRWIRGDWQTASWLGVHIQRADGTRQASPLYNLERFKILDNLIESLAPTATLLLICIGLLRPGQFGLGTILILLAVYVFSLIPTIFQLGHLVEAFFVGELSEFPNRIQQFGKHLLLTLRRSLLELGFLPYIAGTGLDAIVRSLYRQTISHRHLLEWNTAASLKQQTSQRKRLRSYLPGFLVLGSVALILGLGGVNLFVLVALLLLGCCFPLLLERLAQFSPPQPHIRKKDRALLLSAAERSWQYYTDIVQPETAFLPPDHVEEFPAEKIANYTSVTNIGFYLLSILCALKLGYISKEEAYERTAQTVSTLERLPCHKNLFYNWYSLKTFQPDEGGFVSSVDAGNLLACLICTSSWLLDESSSANPLSTFAQTLRTRVEALIQFMDFYSIVSRRRLLLAVGLDPKTQKLSTFYYQTLASESRLSVLLMLAKRNLPLKAWSALSRVIKRQPEGGLAALSWSGTLFEYLMPNLFLAEPADSVMDTSARVAYENNRGYLAEHGLFGALSESGHVYPTASGYYGYKAFGLPTLSLSPRADGKMVVSPYAVALALTMEPTHALSDLRWLSKRAFGRYGFFEAIDFSANPSGQVIGTYMSHHQGMILGAITNFLHEGYLQTLFSRHPLVQTVLFLSDEAMSAPTKELFPEHVKNGQLSNRLDTQN